MKKPLLFHILFLINTLYISSQVFEKEPIKISGDDDKRINLIILSDGYQTHELPLFVTDATNFTNDMFSQSPFIEYANYFNVYAIKVPSNESGADHPASATDVTEPLSPIKNVDTYFNATFDAYGFHRLLFHEIDGNSANNTQLKINTVLANNFPNYDQTLILVNSNVYGGSGGEFPMSSTGTSANEIAIHELGHSLFNLKDEYYPGDTQAAEAINMTQETNPSLVKWKNWIGTNGIGIYPYGVSGTSASWNRPHQACKMQFLGSPFCSVCKEGIIEKIHNLVSPINDYSPNNDTTINTPTFPLNFQLDLIKPIPNTLENTWTLNSTNYANNVDDVSILEANLVKGLNTLTVVINDNTPLLRVDNHQTFHLNTITWAINYTTLGIEDIKSSVNDLRITMSPNPTNHIINLKFENTKDFSLKMDIISIEGKKIKTISISNHENQQIDISSFNKGIYITNFYSNQVLLASKKLVIN
ncbi:peptidase M64 [Flavivirga aquatica]|uniref:Peptidase M64 n=1 Tax=Flavivirga aquatica TaxID=1849968 RepID=A0A1E5SJN2_9FLAO|nr:M64 family metallopeptidase [Flavivirga aquatica]OEJ99311.1 peptidase M64 [Flavivirga aquatica]